MTNSLNRKNNYEQKDTDVRFQNVKNVHRLRDTIENTPARKPMQAAPSILQMKKALSNLILAGLPDYELSRLLPHLEVVYLSPAEDVYKMDEPLHYVYFPEDAVISDIYVLANGNTSEVAMIGQEGAVGLCAIFGSQLMTSWMQVTIAGRAWKIKAEILKQEFNRSGMLQGLLLNYMNAYITQISQKVICTAHHVAEERLCSWLLMIQDRVKNNKLLLTQEQIARHLGVHRPSVTHSAQALKEAGLIDYLRGHINILDRPGLEGSACECYSVIQENVLTRYLDKHIA